MAARRRAARPSLISITRAELRTRPGRFVSLAAGILVAAVSFGLLSSETATSGIQATRTVRRNFRAAYDILVRPRGAQTAFERRHHLVDDGFLSALFGGISMAQYRQIASLPGVSLAAPIANVGYFILSATIFVPFPRSIPRSGRAVYEVTTDWNVHHGLWRYPGAPFYLYYTPHQLSFSSVYSPGVEIAGGKRLASCSGFAQGEHPGPRVVRIGRVSAPYRQALLPGFACSSPGVVVAGKPAGPLSAVGRRGVDLSFSIPVLVAGIDPHAEEKLVGLGKALASGRYLAEGGGLSAPQRVPGPGPRARTYPVLASIDTFLDQAADLTIHRLAVPAGTSLARVLATRRAYSFLTHLNGPSVGRLSVSPTAAWRDILRGFNTAVATGYSPAYWRFSPTRNVIRNGIIHPAVVGNDPGVWSDTSHTAAYIGVSLAPPGSNDTWYRRLRVFGASGQQHIVDGQETSVTPFPRLTGTFNPARLRGFSPLSKVPLQTFFPPRLAAGDAASRRLLGSSALGPTTNLGGYLSQPPLLLTTIQGAIALDNGDGGSYTSTYHYRTRSGRQVTGHVHVQAYAGASPAAPISAIQVRVAGVTGPNALSLAKIKLIAGEIASRTGLTVDITAGSSPTSRKVALAAGRFGQPPLTFSQQWVREDVDAGIIAALDRKDLALFLLIAVSCALFAGSAALAAVRQRRKEIAVLATLGWPGRMIFSLVVGEAAALGLLAGLAGLAVTVSLTAAGALRIPAISLGLTVPVAVTLAVIAAAIPAWQATKITPLEALRDPVRPAGQRRRVRSLTGLALANITQVPGRSLIAAATLALAVAALALIIGLTLAFRGAVAGDLLGNVVSFNVRNVDLISTGLVILVGAASVADVLITSLRERAPELATLRAVGWEDRHVRGMALREGVILGALGSLLGAGAGIAIVALLGGSPAAVLATVALAIAAGCAVTITALTAPLAHLTRGVPAQSLGRE